MFAKAAAILAFGLAATGAAMAQTALYTANPMPSNEAIAAVIKDKTGAAPALITGGSGVLLRRIEAEKAAAKADVLWSSSANTLGAFESLFEAYSSPELATVPASLRYPGDLFQPSNVHVVTMMVNTDQLKGAKAPASWADLADPVWKGRIILPDPVNSSTGYTIVWGLSKMLDPKVYEAVVSNLVVTGSSSAVPKGVAMGEYAIGLTFETNSYSYVDGGQTEIKMVYPDPGTFLTVEYAGLVKDAPGGAAAKKMLDALISKEAQIAVLKAGFRRPTRGDIKVSDYVKLPELAAIKVFETDEADAAKNRTAFLASWAALPKAGTKK